MLKISDPFFYPFRTPKTLYLLIHGLKPNKTHPQPTNNPKTNQKTQTSTLHTDPEQQYNLQFHKDTYSTSTTPYNPEPQLYQPSPITKKPHSQYTLLPEARFSTFHYKFQENRP